MTPRFRFRLVLTGIALGALTVLPGGSPVAAAEKVAPITIVINNSPWFAGFQAVVEYYEEQTGNTVNLDVNPFFGVMEKIRSSSRASRGTIDLFVMSGMVLAEMYSSGLLNTMEEVDPTFVLEEGVSRFDDTVCWDFQKKDYDCTTGKLMGVPINPNILMLYYRADLYEEKGLKIPETWDDYLANGKALNDPPNIYGLVQLGDRSEIGYNFQSYMWSHNGQVFRDRSKGDYTITFNSPETLQALQTYIGLAEGAGHPQTGTVTQSMAIQLGATGKAAQFIAVIAAWAQLDDPNKSIAVGKFQLTNLPRAANGKHYTTLGHFVSGIPKNIPDEKKKADLAFLKWFQSYDTQYEYAKRGGTPVRSDVLTSELSSQERYRWMKPLAENFKNARTPWNIPQGAQLEEIIALRVNQAVIGEMTPQEALNTAAQEMYDIMSKAGYETGRLPDLQ